MALVPRCCGQAAAPPSPQIGTKRCETVAHAAAHPSRAAEIAEIHLASINESRKRCGMPLLTLAELTHEFADLDESLHALRPGKIVETLRTSSRRGRASRSARTSMQCGRASWESSTRRCPQVAARSGRAPPLCPAAEAPPRRSTGPRSPGGSTPKPSSGCRREGMGDKAKSNCRHLIAAGGNAVGGPFPWPARWLGATCGRDAASRAPFFEMRVI